MSEKAETESRTQSLFHAALARLRRRATAAASGAALVSGVAQLPMLAGCAMDEPPVGSSEQDSWSQDQGQRNTQMVSYLGESYTVCKQPNTRFGCGAWETVIKVRIRPVAGASLDWKRVGVSYRMPHDLYDKTAVGHYVGGLPGGDEEWHVPVSLGSSASVLIFDVWYQDGAYHTFVDDNQGEFHIANPGTSFNVLRVEPWLGTVRLDEGGVSGKVSVQLADLDYDKQLVLVGTTDDWATVIELGMGAPGEKNTLVWAEDLWGGYERWQVELDLPCGSATRFQYAVAYRHGIVNGATEYEFWDNNWGQNYIIERPPAVE